MKSIAAAILGALWVGGSTAGQQAPRCSLSQALTREELLSQFLARKRPVEVRPGTLHQALQPFFARLWTSRFRAVRSGSTTRARTRSPVVSTSPT
jgi:hypothetical protein